MKKISLILTLIFVVSSLVYSQERYQGDLSFKNNSNSAITVTVESETIPFEGLNRYINDNNRIFEIQNGVIFRQYDQYLQYDEWQVAKHTFVVDPGPAFVMTFCSANTDPADPYVYGYGKYKVTITTPNKIYISYFNNLDSKYGTEINGNTYANDFRYIFNSENQSIEFWGTGSVNQLYGYVFPQPNTIPEFKVWECCFDPPRTQPLDSEFYARTTPFGYRPDIDNTYRETASIGKRIILDHVYKYSSTSQCGYNTSTYPVDYFTDPYDYIPENDTGYTYLTPSYLFTNGSQQYYGIEFYADPGCIMELKNNIKFWISAMTENVNGDKLRLKIGSKIIMGNGAKIQTYFTGKYIDEGSIKELSSGTVFRAWQHSSFELTGNNVIHTYNNSVNMVIDGGATLKIGDNTTVIFDGENSKLQLKQQSIVQLGENAKIKFINGAYLDANGAIFSSLGSSPWQGLEFENAGSTSNASTISNCTFNNAITPININNSGSSANNSISITGNTINLSSSGSQGIHAGNVSNLLVQSNTFNLQPNTVSGLYIQNSPNTGNSANNNININIIGNTFNSGISAMLLICYADLTPFYIYGNIFNNNSSYNIIARSISGNIKNNSSNNYNVEHSLFLVQSNPNVYGNTFYSSQSNLFLDLGSYPRLSPLIKSDAASWVGGMNTLNSSNDNIQFSSASYAFLDRGMNLFSKPNPSNYYHLYGDVHVWESEYYVRDNCFNGQYIPQYDLWEGSNIVTPVYEGSTFNCNASTDDGIGWEVSGKGFGIIDSVLITNPPSGVQLTLDEVLYTQANNQRINGYYLNAISAYKSLIDSFTSSLNVYPALSELYECYQGLDTSSEQNNRNILYGNLLTYLNNKISSGLYDLSFVDIAYNLTLMCYTNMTEYTEAKDGYEFLAIYHPDPIARFYASLDYAIIEALLNSGSSISSKEENLPDETFLEQRINRLEESGDPVKQILKKTYNLKKEEKERNLNKEIEKKSTDKKSATKMIEKIKSEENNINLRTLSNIRSLNKMNTKDKEKKKIEDILYSAKISSYRMNRDNSIINTFPANFELFQNYPNPFNPTTTINYSLPKNRFVTMKIYDITGREIIQLVNEYKQAGYYTVNFNGSNLASGVYFYKIQAGDFVGVKRMVLIK